MTDSEALEIIASLMSETDWDADTLDAIADAIRATGRTINDTETPW